ncbi:MAG: UvrD-helicase domain-containing protein [Gammaproteobacteria bacterium]
MTTEQHVADLDQRLRAIEPDESFIVQAPAGSGKTELLIQRYLRLLSVVEAPEEIVAITFTRKAAAEMRGRIIDALERVVDGNTPDDEAARKTDVLANAAMTRNREQGWQLEDNPGRLRIQTIDSLCGALTRQMPVLSRFGAQPEIVEDATELYEQAAADTLAELESGQGWSDAIAVLLAHLDNDLPRIRNMLAGMLARRDQWLRHVAGEIRREELEGALRHVAEETLSAARRDFPDGDGREVAELLDFAAANLEREERESPARACAGLTELPSAAAGSLPQWQGLVALLLKSDGNWRQSPTARDGFPAAGKTGEAEQRTAMKDRFKALIARLSEDDSLSRQLLAIRHLPPVAYTDEEWQVVQALCELLKLADARLWLLCSEQNRIDFSGITQAAIQALGDEEAPTDLALNLDYRIRHILVDEFQDISINQFTLLQRLTAGWSMEDGHSLFLVGDPMQSIYRFREAEVGLFLNAWEERRLGQVPVTPLHIRVNFRSQSGLVQWVNEVFTQVLPQTADPGRGAVHYTPAEAYHNHLDGDAVRLHTLVDDSQSEADIVLQQVLAAREADPEGRVAILVRGRTHLLDIVPRLKQAGLRYRAVDIDPLGEQPAIQDLMALTRALHHFADGIAWLAVLRAPWCGLDLADLLALAGGSRERTVWECILDEACVQALSEAGRGRLLRLRPVLQAALRDRQRLSLSRWVESVWLRIGGPATLNSETDLENARSFFDLLEQFDDGGDLKDRDGFMEQVSSLYAAADIHADDHLQIMTIHKAKGLEFDTVILPGLSRGSRNDDTRLLLWSESPHRDHQDLLLAPVKEAGADESPVYQFLRRLDREKQSFEDGRLLYVAATRAKKKLHLIASVKSRERDGELSPVPPRADSLLAQLWPVAEAQCRDAVLRNGAPALPGRPQGSGPQPRTLRRLIAGWSLPQAPDAVDWHPRDVDEVVHEDTVDIEYEWAGEAIKHIGTVVHRCIQRIADEGIEQWNEDRIRSGRDYYRLSLKRLGIPDAGEDMNEALATVEDALVNLIRDRRAHWLLDHRHGDARNEYAVSGVYAGKLINVVLDRTFIDEEGVRWIVDYKTSRHKGGNVDAFLDRERERYREQLERYAAVVRNMDNRPVKLGLYFPLLQGWREWGNDEKV